MSRPYKFGGLSFIVVGVLFLSKYLLDLLVGPPPSSGDGIVVWTARNELPLAITNEVLFFAAGFLVPAVIALYWRLAPFDRTKAAVGCGLIAVVIPIIAVLDIFHGRLVYPVLGWRADTPVVAEFLVAVYLGGLHAIGILFGVATVVLSMAMLRSTFGVNVAYLGFVVAVFDFIGAYPETIGPTLIAISQVLLAAWLIAVGWKLYRVREPVTGLSMLGNDQVSRRYGLEVENSPVVVGLTIGLPAPAEAEPTTRGTSSVARATANAR